jgi:putative phage-type endonuclease
MNMTMLPEQEVRLFDWRLRRALKADGVIGIVNKMAISFDKPSDPVYGRVGRHASYMVDRLINAGASLEEAMAVLRHCVDDRVSAEQYTARIVERESMTTYVDGLPKGIPQRTPDWYAAREGLITASNFHKAAAKPEQFIREKFAAKPFLGSDATRWGVKYEDVACLLYSHYNNTPVYEYGLLHHPTVAHLGASPDGITPYGVMVEIKCPYSKTLKDIPEEYWAQMQGQLEVTGLTECDFVVCRVRGVSEEACKGAMMEASDPARYGAVASYTDGSFRFSKPGQAFTELLQFKDYHMAQGAEVSFHHVFDFTVTRVIKNEEAWKEMEQKLARTWSMLHDAKLGKGAAVLQPEAPAFPFKIF